MNELGEPARGHARQWSMATANDMLQEVTLLAWMSFCRSQNGEHLHAQQQLGAAVDVLLCMLGRYAADDGFARISASSPRRRMHAISPILARELLALLFGTVAIPEARLLEIAERHLRARTPRLNWAELASIRERMQSAAAPRHHDSGR